jgi:hypothetical protein
MKRLDHRKCLDAILIEKGLSGVFFNENILSEPIRLSESEVRVRIQNYKSIQSFFETALQLFQDVLVTSQNEYLVNLLLNDSTSKVPISFYRSLPKEAWTTPLFYRTDASRNGKVYEIQCPGSGWGDVILLEEIYKKQIGEEAYPYYGMKERFQRSVQIVTNTESPIVMHLLDNSSNPCMMRFFINETTNPLRYWGYTVGLRSPECQLIRSHSVYGLLAENLFQIRLDNLKDGKVKFDTPPILLFDQKMILCLPFMKETRGHFSDEIRKTLAYSVPLTPKGFLDHDGTWVSLSDFHNRPSSGRKYFLKYGGCDTSINWGSRAVYRLDSTSSKRHTDLAVADYLQGRPWIIQPDYSEKEEVSYTANAELGEVTEKLTAKYSTFYGPMGVMAIRTHHRRGTKVHGQPDSVAGMAY